MNKSIHYIIILILINISIARAVDLTYKRDEVEKIVKCNGGFLKCKIYSIYFKDGIVQNKKKKLNETLKFNNIGYCTERKPSILYSSNDPDDDNQLYIYDSTNKIIEVKSINIKEKTLKKYLYNNKLLNAIIINNNESYIPDTAKYYYNLNNQIVKIESVSRFGLEEYIEYEYNINMSISKKYIICITGVHDTIKLEYLYHYDKHNNLIQRKRNYIQISEHLYNYKHEIIEGIKNDKFTFEDMNSRIKYDNYGNIIEITYYDYMDEPILRFVYIYSK